MTKANEYYNILKKHYPKADALYEDTIIDLVGREGLRALREAHKIETCAMFYGRKLYAIQKGQRKICTTSTIFSTTSNPTKAKSVVCFAATQKRGCSQQALYSVTETMFRPCLSLIPDPKEKNALPIWKLSSTMEPFHFSSALCFKAKQKNILNYDHKVRKGKLLWQRQL